MLAHCHHGRSSGRILQSYHELRAKLVSPQSLDTMLEFCLLTNTHPANTIQGEASPDHSSGGVFDCSLQEIWVKVFTHLPTNRIHSFRRQFLVVSLLFANYSKV